MVGMPKRTEASSANPRRRSAQAPMSGTMTVPTLPPAMCALMAKPRRSVGNCSASRPLPTGCCGEPPTLETTSPPPKATMPGARAINASKPPMTTPPPCRAGGPA